MPSPQSPPPVFPFEPGDVATPTYGMGFDRNFYSLEAQAGRPAALLFVGALPLESVRDLLQAFRRRARDFDAREADVVALIDVETPHLNAYGLDATPEIKKILCERDVLARWGVDGTAPLVVVIDRGARIVAAFDPEAVETAVEDALRCIAALPVETPRDVALPAPVLAIPDIFNRKFCRDLIAHFEASPFARGGMAARDAQGRLYHKVDEAKKRRYDFVLGPGDRMLGRVLEGLILRCLPEVKKAFQVDVRHTDRILIARYDDDGGYFRRHRDNTAPGLEYRQFALSLNLNSEDYEGGSVIFPEYNSHRYKPATGAGVVFSCSLLHEAMPVTKGRRYVLLTFLHDAAAQARWMAGDKAAAA